MGLDINTWVGEQRIGDGRGGPPRQGNLGELVISNLQARFSEQTLRGNVFHAPTLAAGVSPGTSLGATAAYALANPANSRVALVVVRTSLAYVSGTLAGGVMYYCANVDANQAQPTGGTALAVLNGYVGGPAGMGKAYAGATLPAAPTPIMPFCSLAPILNSTAVAPWSVTDYPEGLLVVPPGEILSLEAVLGTGSSSPLVAPSMAWIEVPI